MRLALLALIVLGGVGVKLAAWPAPVGHHALDGSNYYQVAGHVAAGDGLQTRLSLYHQGFQSFPHASNIYPLWPLLLGHTARIVDLATAAVALPVALYGLSLVLLYGLANRLAVAFSGGNDVSWSRAPNLTVGHVAALLFALNPVFFRHTSLPYAEGLVYATTFASLLAVDKTRERASLSWAFIAGVLAGCAFLSRPQLLPLALAVPASVFVTAHDARDLRASAVALLSAGSVVALWAWHLSGFVVPFSPLVLLDYASYRETDGLAPFPITLGAESWTAYLSDRLTGFVAAFDPTHPNAYARSFGAAVYLVPLALVVVALRAPTLRAFWSWLRAKESRTVVATLATGVGALAAVHVHHGTLIWEWWFHWRHGLPMILPITLALALLLTSAPGWLRAVSVVLIAGSLVTGAVAVHDNAVFLRFATAGPSEDERALVRWADESEEPVRLVSTKAQALAAFSTRAGFHWTVCGDDPRQTARLLSAAGADYLVVYPGEENCRAIRALLPELRPVEAFGDLRVLAPPSVARTREPQVSGGSPSSLTG
ncbi:MAG: hypothetical protein P8R42_13500 [Candidatus Binatia bacterium]|nr:hypothetical protein [Candidatus Binatia bacterium]